MKFRIELDLDNSSMIDSNYNEISTILLTHTIKIVEECKANRTKPVFNDYYHNIMDINGNSIGHWSVKNK